MTYEEDLFWTPGHKLKLRNEVEYTSSSRSRGTQISGLSVVPITGIVIINTLCAQFEMLCEMEVLIAIL
jgi:hypothetical protein